MLCDRLEALAEGYRDLGGVKWFMAEIHSSDLFASLPCFFAGAHAEELRLLHVVDWIAQLDHSVWAQFAALEETFADGTGALVRVFRDLGRPVVLELLFESLRILLIVGNVAALLAAIVLCFRPSLLKGVEAWGDRHYSGRESTKPLDIMRYQPDDFVRARPRVVGAIVVLGSAYVLIALGLRLL